MAGDGSKGLTTTDTKESGNRSAATEPQVLVEEYGFARFLTLNRPHQLNVLSSQMVSQLLELFVTYSDDPNVKLLIMKGKGRAFCAGGDVAAVVNSINQGHWTLGAKFFWNEFILNYIIVTYNKPQDSIFNGIGNGEVEREQER